MVWVVGGRKAHLKLTETGIPCLEVDAHPLGAHGMDLHSATAALVGNDRGSAPLGCRYRDIDIDTGTDMNIDIYI